MLEVIRYSIVMAGKPLRSWGPMLITLSFAYFLLELMGALVFVQLLFLLSSGNTASQFVGTGNWWEAFVPDDIRLCLVFVIAIYTAKNVVRFIDLLLRGLFVEQVILKVSKSIFRNYLAEPFENHLMTHSSNLTRSLSRDLDETTRNVLLAVLGLISEMVVILALLVTLLISVPGQALVVAIVMFGLAAIVVAMAKQSHLKWGESYHEALSAFLKNLQETFSNIPQVRMTQSETFVESQFLKTRQAVGSLVRHRSLIESWPALILEVLLVMGLVATIYLAMNTPNYDSVLPVLGIFAYVGLRLLPSIGKALGLAAAIQTSREIVKNVYDVAMKAVVQTNHGNPPISFRKELSIENVSYLYPGGEAFQLRGISFQVRPGESVAIVGESGCGKTTLVYLLLGLLTPNDGKILADGKNIQDSSCDWRSMIGYVPQETTLFANTVQANIAFGFNDDEIDRDMLSAVIEQAQLSDWVKSLPNGVQTHVGESGQQISGGQRQRIMIARALYRQPEVLIFDEPTSSLDQQTEREMEAAILNTDKTKARIIVTHRMETAKECDKIAFIHGGQLAGTGNYDVLLKTNERFRLFASELSDTT